MTIRSILASAIACVALAVAPLAHAADKELNLFAWSEYVPEKVIEGFKAETGIKVNYETYASNEEMLTKLNTGSTKYDLIQPSEYTVELLIKDGKLSPIDWSKIPNFKNIGDEYKKLGHDPEQKYSCPWMIGTVGIVYNSDKIKGPITGYADVFVPKHNQKIIVLDDNREIATWAMNVLNIDYNKPPEDLSKVKQLLVKWLPLVRGYDSDSPKTLLFNGDVDLGIVWSGEAALCIKQDKKFKYVLPKEGTHMFIDSLCIPANSEHKEEAMQFINYILKPEVSRLISEAFPYTNPNKEARKLLTKEELENPASYPPAGMKLGIFRDIGAKAAELDTMVSEVRGK